MGAVAADAAVDSDRTDAVYDSQITVRLAHDASGLLCAGVDGAVDVQVLHRGVLHVAEGGTVFLRERTLGSAFVEGQRLAVAVEGTLERVRIVRTYHRRDTDILHQFHHLVAIAVAAIDRIGEQVPVVSVADDEGIRFRSSAKESIDVRYHLATCNVFGSDDGRRTVKEELLALGKGDAVHGETACAMDVVAGVGPAERQGAACCVICIRTDAGSIRSSRDGQLTAIDGERAGRSGTNARLVGIAAVDDQCTRTFDGQCVARAQFDALLGRERSALAEMQHHVAVDGDAALNFHVGINHVFTIVQCACYISVEHINLNGLCTVAGAAVEGNGVDALFLHGGGTDGVCIVAALRQSRATDADDCGFIDGDFVARIGIDIVAADGAGDVEVPAVDAMRLIQFAGGNGGAGLHGTRNSADLVRRAYLRIQVVEAVADGGGSAMQAHGVHRRDVFVGACLQTVLEHGAARVAPSPDAADVGTIATHAVDGAGEDAVLNGGGRVLAVADDAAGVVVVLVQRGGDGAAFNQVGAEGEAHDARRVVTGRGDGAGHGQFLDGGILDVVEGCHALLVPSCARCRAAEVGRQRMSVAEEGAAEGVVAIQTCGRGDGDVGIQSEILVAETVAVVDAPYKFVPMLSAADDVGVVLRACCLQQLGFGCEVRYDIDIAPRHSERIYIIITGKFNRIAIGILDIDIP